MVIDAFFAFITLVVELIALVVEALVYAVAYLLGKPRDNAPRFSGQRLLAAFAPLAVVLAIIAGFWGWFHWRTEVQPARIHATQVLANEHSERLVNQVDEEGRLVQHPSPLDVEDAWGNPLHVECDETLTHQVVVVRSAGPDKEYTTWDDITAQQKRLRPSAETALGVLNKAKEMLDEHNDREKPQNP